MNMFLFAMLIVTASGIFAVYGPKIAAHEVAKTLVLPPSGPAEVINLNRYLTRLVTDRKVESAFKIPSIAESEFASVLEAHGPGYTDRTIWYRTPVKIVDQPGRTGRSAFIDIGQVYLNDIEISILSNDARQIIWQEHLGDRIPRAKGGLQNLSHVAEWPKLSLGEYWLVIAVHTNSAHVFEAELLPDTALIPKSGSNSFIKGAILGVLLLAFGIYFAFGVMSGDRSVLWYSGYIFSLFLVSFGVTGYAQLIFKPFWSLASDFVTGTGTAFALGTSIMMWSYMTRLDRENRPLFRVMVSYSVLAMAGFLTATSDWYILYAKVFFGPQIFLLAVMLINLMYRGYRQKHTFQMSYLMVALGVPTIGAMAHLLLLIGWLPVNGFTTSIFALSSLIQLVLVAIAMAYRTYGVINRRVDALASGQRADQLASEQRTFITMLSHEFRTPLAIIQRSAEILGLHLQKEPESVLNRLSTIQSNARQLSGLVDAFLTKETLDSATFTTTREAVAINAFLSDLIAQRQREVPGQNISLIQSDVVIVEIDRILMERALFNLIENARKYAPGAAVWISAERAANGYVYIRVVDEGPGIAADDLQNVLNAFYRGRDSVKTQGVGLGLHLTKRIIEAHDGSLSVSVGEEGGTTILIKLPYDRDMTVLRNNENRAGFPLGYTETSHGGERP
ncbi:MAG: sensor histidine kinase [Thalassospira sp.]|nr:sensor histidine kinase [Thalassospira sp.]MBO6804537.1 sensor histidine kinase [Thalassospira sp.]MBO6818814.1 sensor histidine kinase [Thalassospira sp.]MBO6887748.1 sensor histidine kinase [Thalassospira sp.]